MTARTRATWTRLVGRRKNDLKTNYILIDYESLQPDAMTELDREHFKVVVFVGANQTKLRYDTATALHRMGSRANYIKISGNGPNALDFHIAFYIGKLATEEPDAYFHIVSKDTGFDPLIAHLKTRQILASRSEDVSAIPLLKAGNAKSTEDRLASILGNLRQRGPAKPGTVRTLFSTISTLFQKELSEAELSALIEEMKSRGWISLQGVKISYALPA
jgi:PIN domain